MKKRGSPFILITEGKPHLLFFFLGHVGNNPHALFLLLEVGKMYSNSSLVNYTNLTRHHSGTRKHKIDRITIHCFVGQVSAKRGCDYFAETERECSANYVIGYDGQIGLSVEEKNRSWCSSSSENDNRAVTIEVASDTYHPYAVTDEAFAAVIKLCTDICKRNGLKKVIWFGDKTKSLTYEPQEGECVLTVHRWFAAKACPGQYLYDRHAEIAEKINKELQGGCEEMGCPFWNGTKCTKDEKPQESLQLLDTVKLSPDAVVYNTNRRYASWVYNSTLYVREISGDRIVVSTLKSGAITGAVDRKYLIKV